MTEVEMKQAIEQLKAENHNDEEILGAFFKMFQDDKLTSDELDGITNLMGYHFSDEFAALPDEQKKTMGYEKVENPNVDKETVEDAKEVDKPEDNGEDKGDAESNPESNENDDKSEDKSEDKSDEEKEAMRLFGLKK